MLELEVKLTIIEDLGIKLYGSLPPVISELISNSWDADASRVNITLPETISKTSFIKIEDNGHSLSYDDIQSKYLKIGRKRRLEDGDKTKKGRKVIGSKGLGKLSVFGIANIVEITTIKNKKITKFKMDLKAVIKSARQTGKYKPQIIIDKKPTNKKNGTIIILRDLKHKKKIKIDEIRKKISKHFIIIGSKFDVKINKKSITPSDKISEKDIEYTWNIENIPNNKIDKFRISGRIDQRKKWIVTGKIFTTFKTLSEGDRGIVLLSRGKLIHIGTTFDIKSGQKYSYSYMTGELSVEFLDELDKDLISTDRQSIAWDTVEAEALKKWGDKTLKNITTHWDKLRKNSKLKKIRANVDTKTWLNGLEPYQRKLANRIIDLVADTQTQDSKTLNGVIQYCRSSFGYTAFKNFISKIDDSPNPVELLQLAEKWKLVEAQEIYNIVDGRLSTIQKFERFVKTNAKEIPTIHEILKKSPWLIEPTWTYWNDEVYFSKLLRDKFPNSKLTRPNKRIDFISISSGNILNIIEIKRPNHTVINKDMDQLFKYVSFAEEHIGNTPNRKLQSVVGYLLAGKMPNNFEMIKTIQESASNRRYVRTYDELVQSAHELHKEYKSKLPKY